MGVIRIVVLMCMVEQGLHICTMMTKFSRPHVSPSRQFLKCTWVFHRGTCPSLVETLPKRISLGGLDDKSLTSWKERNGSILFKSGVNVREGEGKLGQPKSFGDWIPDGFAGKTTAEASEALYHEHLMRFNRIEVVKEHFQFGDKQRTTGEVAGGEI